MLIKACTGDNLEKTSKTSPEDSFTRSTVTFDSEDKERTFHLVYVRFFAEKMNTFTPFEEDPIFTVSNRKVNFRDIAALVALIQNPDYRQRKRVYMNEETAFKALFADIDYKEVKKVFENLEAQGTYEFQSSIPFLKQPNKLYTRK